MDQPRNDREKGRGRLVTVFGGTGFLGRRIVRHLLQHGFAVRAASRHTERASELFTEDTPAPEAVRAEIRDKASVATALDGAFAAVNAVSLYTERGGETFQAVHVEAAARVADIARQTGVQRLVHVSGIGADPRAESEYVRARGEGEAAVRQAFPSAIIMRPSAMFGPGDALLTMLAGLVRTLPVYPLFGDGTTRLQPVFVEDVAEAVARLLAGTGPAASCHEFGGPRAFTYAELVHAVAGGLGERVRLVPLPFAVWSAIARVAEVMPGTPLTRDQVALMRHDNVAASGMPGLTELGIDPTPIEAVLPAIGGGQRKGRT